MPSILARPAIPPESRKWHNRRTQARQALGRKDVFEEGVGEWSTIALTVDGERQIALLTLNRPAALNAISRELASDLFDACALLSGRTDVRVVVLTGAGDRAFCAGADLKERRTLNGQERAEHTVAIEAAAEALATLPMPVIAAIRGYALAGGAELAIACDLRVAGTNSVLGFPEVKIGIFPGAGGMLRLPAIVGSGAARDLLFSGRQVDAGEALRIGLIDRLTAPDVVLDEAIGIAESIAANAPLAIRAVKQALFESGGQPYAIARQRVNALRATLDATADYEEGLQAFAERRAPRFTGR
jgi:enoyl-CoA hydratase/carnithine racemase